MYSHHFLKVIPKSMLSTPETRARKICIWPTFFCFMFSKLLNFASFCCLSL
jgi:hypothetical protein